VIADTDLRALIARAFFLFERLEGAGGCMPSPTDSVTVQARLDAWDARIGADLPPDAVQRYRDWLSLDPNMVHRAVGAVELPPDEALPDWARTLAEILATPMDPTALDFSGRDPVPFGVVWSPLAVIVRQRLQVAAPAGWNRLTHTAQTDLLWPLVKRMATGAAELLYPRFDTFRQKKLGPLASFTVAGTRTVYDAFLTLLNTNGLHDLFHTYPVLGRIIANRTHYWAEAHAEMLARLDADWSEITSAFGRGQDMGAICGIQTGTSDYHRGGRGMVILTFTSGLRLVYKAKPMGMERAYNDLLRWLNTQGAPVTLYPLHVLDCGVYGWVEFAEHAPCSDHAAAERYYARIGGLACLLYVLLGTDCHFENVVAAGESPVLVDAETLFNPGLLLDDIPAASAHHQVQRVLRRSVLGSLLLPQWITFGAGQSAIDISAVGALDPQPLTTLQTVWKHCETDRMKPVRSPITLVPRANVPWIGALNTGTIARPEHFDTAIIDGFLKLGRFLIEQHEALMADDGPLRQFAGQEVRYLVRHTNAYTALFESLFNPAHLTDGVAYSLPLETLARAYLPHTDDPTTRVLLTAERSALMRGDIPFFASQPGSTGLFTDTGECIADDYFAQSPAEQVIERLRNLDERELGWQSRLMAGSIAARVSVSSSAPHADTAETILGDAAATPTSPDVLQAAADAIVQQLAAEAIHGADGSVTWMMPTYHEQTTRTHLAAIPLDLYQGQAGIALFLAAAATISSEAAGLARAALIPIRHQLRGTLTSAGIGAGFGVGAWIYALTRGAGFLDDPTLLPVLLDEAQTAVDQIDPARIAADPRFDVLNGAAGLLLALLTLYEITGSPRTLALAQVCGQHLLDSRIPTTTGHVAWDTTGDGTHWIGFSHGAAGIAYALARLYGVTGDERLREAVETAVNYEAQHFDVTLENWPRVQPHALHDNPASAVNRVWATWCHGAPGIGLARAAMAQWITSPSINADIEVALRTTKTALRDLPSSGSLLCCGDLGRIDCLFTAGLLTDDESAVTLARRFAGRVVWSDAVGQPQTMYRFGSPLRRALPPPGLFVGMAGIGYQLLRLANPQRVPSVLLWG
jgi:type 2 lantibiotic biosynthesis protein LanM